MASARAHGIVAACGTAADLAHGAAIVVEPVPRDGPAFGAGVVPNDVAQVQIILTDGTKRTAPVASNAYLVKTRRPIARISFSLNGESTRQFNLPKGAR